MSFLASSSAAPASNERIAEATQVSPGYLSKVMRDLVVAGLVVSQRGPRGGFALSRPADRISILDVVNAVDPIRRIKECPLGNPLHQRLCPLHARLDAAIATIEQSLSATTLAELRGQDAVPGQCSSLLGAMNVGVPGRTPMAG
jgi:Rrf2 family protein